ncbi:MAG: SDR family NAD(P)-dependent oxidoreductase [Xanthobacteraceae bacterium]
MLTTDGFRLDGRVAIVTGSGRNIGRAVAECFAAAGAKVVVNGHSDQDAVDAVVRGIRERGGEAAGVIADVSKDAEVSRLVETTAKTFGMVDVVVSNVGIRRMRPFLEISPDEWREVIETNLSAAFYLARHALPHMLEQKKGRIIVISGFDGFWGQVTHRAHNVTAKAGLHGLAKAIGREFGESGITANTVAPGAIDTVRDWSQYAHQAKEKIQAEIPLKRFGDVDEIAAACLFLASDAGGFVSGQVIHVNGGHYMY